MTSPPDPDGRVVCESGPPQLRQDRPQLSEVYIPAGAVYNEVVMKDLVHHPLERGRSAMYAKRKDRVLVQSPRGRKRCFLPSGPGEWHLPVPLGEVQGG